MSVSLQKKIYFTIFFIFSSFVTHLASADFEVSKVHSSEQISLEKRISEDPYLLEQITYEERDIIASLLTPDESESQRWDLATEEERLEYETSLSLERMERLQQSVSRINQKWDLHFETSDSVKEESEEFTRRFFGEKLYELLGLANEPEPIGPYGDCELSDRVRVSYINGILNTREMMLESLRTISESHGGIIVHNVFRPTLGWTKDVLQAITIKTTYVVGVYSKYARDLAVLWRSLIDEMGGCEGGGVIIHYAHSLGGSDTDRARDLLTPEEQKLIRVVTFGSPTMVRNQGFQSVINIRSSCDFIPMFDVLGYVRNYFDAHTNVYIQTAEDAPMWPFDHVLTGSSYGPVLQEMGKEFQKQFVP